jgi:acyl carrier protein
MTSSTPGLEQRVEEIWNDVLGVIPGSEPGATFFELRGESISAIRLVSRIEDELGVALDVADIFEDDPTLAELGHMVAAKADTSNAA